MRTRAATFAAARTARFDKGDDTKSTPRGGRGRVLICSNHLARQLRLRRSGRKNSCIVANSGRVIVGRAKRGQPRRRRQQARLAARFGAEPQEHATLHASFPRETVRRAFPRLPEPERARSTDPSSPRRRRGAADSRASTADPIHREPPLAPGDPGLAAAPSKFSK
jgi:hypothetical protein